MGKRTGGGLANLAYYNAFKHLFPCVVDLAMAEENCIGMYADAIHVPRRGFVKKIIGIVHGEFHRNLAFFRHYVRAVAGKYSCCVINGGVYAISTPRTFTSTMSPTLTASNGCLI